MSNKFKNWILVEIDVNAESADIISNFCFENDSTGVENCGNSVKAYFNDSADIELLKTKLNSFIDSLIEMKILLVKPALTINEVNEEDWSENWKEHFQPIKTGEKLIILPPWEADSGEKGRIRIIIDPGMAFGTGNHESTELALVLLEQYVEDEMTVWDIGTGSGILAIAAAKLGAGHVCAIDNDDVAVDAAKNNIAVNKTENLIHPECRDISDTTGNKYDLVIANLNRKLVVDNAELIRDSLDSGGTVILSGLEESDETEVLQKFIGLGFSLHNREAKNGWTGLVFCAEQ